MNRMSNTRLAVRVQESCRQLADICSSAVRPSEDMSRATDILRVNWHLGLTAFGGPPVHFQIFHEKFVEKEKWIDEQLYQEIFGLSQALPGPASTKMLYCINDIHGGFLAGVCCFLIWCLPGAIGMYGLSIGVSRIGDTLPRPVYALLSGLNAASVGIIALAAVQLSAKAITDKLTRLLVFFSGVAGMLYTALWYYPFLMVIAGIITVIWDYRWLHRAARPFIPRRPLERQAEEQAAAEDIIRIEQLGVTPNDEERPIRRAIASDQQRITPSSEDAELDAANDNSSRESNRIIPSNMQLNLLTWRIGIYIISGFLATFIAVILLRTLLKSPPLGLSLFANLYLAGTIIFGGGPVVIPLLREYIVAEGWVSPRDFLLGLAVIQAFPGPNFNFAIYLGALATVKASLLSFVGALIGFIGIFLPGMAIFTGVMGLWNVLRSRRWLHSLLRGVNAGAVGLVFTAFYKLWQIGYVDGITGHGNPLGGDPWWVAVTAGSYVGGQWFGMSAPVAILCGGVLGLIWYGVVQA